MSSLGRQHHEGTPASRLTTANVEEFRALLQQESGVILEQDEAWRRARQLVGLYRMLMGPIPEDPGVQTSDHLPTAPVDSARMLE